MNWLDLGIVLFVVVLLVIGIKKGFMTSVLSHFSFSFNIVVSFFLTKPFTLLYNKLFNLSGAIFNSYSEKFISLSPNFSTNLLSIESSKLNSFVSDTLNEGNFSALEKGLFNVFLNKPSLHSELHSSTHTSRTLADILGQTYASFFTTLISFVTCFILLYIIILIIGLIVKKIRPVSFVKFIDNTLGAVYGLFRCLLIFIGICFVIKLLSPFAFMTSVTNYISDSLFGKVIYNQISSFIDNYLSFSDIINSIFK